MLVTHYPEDIIPEIKRVVLLKNGTVFADGSKDRLLTDGVMSELFDVPLHVQRMIAGRSTERPRKLLIPLHPPRRLRDQPYLIARFRDPLLTLRRHLLYPARRVRNPPRPVCKQTKISMMLVKRNISRL